MTFADWLNRPGGVGDQLRAVYDAGYKEGHSDADKLCEPRHAEDAERIRQLEAELGDALHVVEVARQTCERRAPNKRSPLEAALEYWESRSCGVCGLRRYDRNGNKHECPPGFRKASG